TAGTTSTSGSAPAGTIWRRSRTRACGCSGGRRASCSGGGRPRTSRRGASSSPTPPSTPGASSRRPTSAGGGGAPGGGVPVVASVGATKETVADGGLVVWGPNGTRSNPYSRAWQDFYVQCARAVLFEANTRLSIRARGLERAKLFTWDRSYQEFWGPTV